MSYISFIGIDVSKNVFDVACHDRPHRTAPFANSSTGFKAFAKAFATELAGALVVLEATGGYESALLAFLVKQRVAAHRAHPTQAKHFIRSLGHKGKTDKLDAKALARYGAERHQSLALWTPPTPEQQELQALTSRRTDLVAMRVAEQNRRAHPRYAGLEKSIDKLLRCIRKEIEAIEAKMETLIARAPKLAAKRKIMTAIKGVGARTATTLIAEMPELGTMTRRQAASLAGLAPHPRDSGMSSKYRPTSGGRQAVRQALFMAAMTAIRANEPLKAFFNKLVNNGKKRIVALVATMRKLITIINARLRDATPLTTW